MQAPPGGPEVPPLSVVRESGRLESMETTLLERRDVSLVPGAATAAAPETAVELRPAWCLLAAPVAVALAVAALVVARGGDGVTASQVIGAVLVTLWALAGLSLGVRRRHDRLGPIVLAGAVLGGGLCLAQAVGGRDDLDEWQDTAAIAVRLLACLLPAVALHMLTSLPDGRLRSTTRRRGVIAGYVVALVTGGVMCLDLDDVAAWPVALLWVAALGIGVATCHQRYVRAGAEERRRIQWIGWGLTVTAEAVLVIIALRLLSDWPDSPGAAALAITGLVPLSVIAGTFPKLVARVDRLLTHTVALAGLTALVLAVYVVVVLGLGRTPSGGERSLLLLSMVAAGICALLYLPARHWLTARANRMVYGERVAPDETVRTFGQRLTRSIPLDELMLQLAENLRKSMILTSAEIWTGKDGHYELMSGVPHRKPAPVEIGAKEMGVVARAGVSGGTWLDIWVPNSSSRRGARQCAWRRWRTAGCCSDSSSPRGVRTASRSPRARTRSSPSSPARSGWRCTTCSSTPRCRPASTNCASATSSCRSRGRASWRLVTPSGASWSATSTTAPSSTSWRWPSSCASPTTRSRTTPRTRWR